MLLLRLRSVRNRAGIACRRCVASSANFPQMFAYTNRGGFECGNAVGARFAAKSFPTVCLSRLLGVHSAVSVVSALVWVPELPGCLGIPSTLLVRDTPPSALRDRNVGADEQQLFRITSSRALAFFFVFVVVVPPIPARRVLAENPADVTLFRETRLQRHK